MSKGKQEGVVAAGHELTAQRHAEILQDGGNAFDAAMAGTFMTSSRKPYSPRPAAVASSWLGSANKERQPRLFDFFAETPLKRRPASEIDFFPIDADFGPAKQEFGISDLARAPRQAWCPACSRCTRLCADCR